MSCDLFDVIIVGAGPAGIAAAMVSARAGLSTVLLERGNYPGSKNLFGGILFTPELEKLVPSFLEKAPLERHMSRRRFSFLTTDGELALDLWSNRFNQPPFNHSFTVMRSKFDRWFATQAEEAGVQLLTGVVVDDLVWKDEKVVGIKARGEKEGQFDELYASLVICAEGANSLLAEKSGLRSGKSKMTPQNRTVAVKEVLRLTKEKIQDRFNVREKEGVSVVYLGEVVKGALGTGFLYTYEDSISVGLGCEMKDLIDRKMAPYDLLDHMKSHPVIAPLIEGGEVIEYSTHMIPEDSFRNLPELATHGLMLVGDSAGLINNSIFQEGTNMAIASGLFAGETAVEAKQKKDFSLSTLSRYREKLENSFVLKDMRHYGGFLDMMREHREYLGLYPELTLEFLVNYFTVDGRSKKEIKKETFRKLRKKISIPKLIMDMIRARKMI
ncbi:MAG: FAD-dependent oxidoreductase [Chlamydiae bacterium]|nr:FAD-dependent oxidoreductase [Chlamydiota bacterium]MBI3266674.1 FAD-dependent oxidoreductase [Chlamydiota bacterium]